MSDPISSHHILFYLNGNRRLLPAADVLDLNLLTYLRTIERLTGAKLGCGEGGCGACTVLVTRFDTHSRTLHHAPVNACLFPMPALDGAAVTTVEAIGDRAGGLAPIQEALANANGSQCGFCTPGIVMSAYAMLRQRAADGVAVTEENIEHAFDGNLCRCTGYRPILAGLRSLVVETKGDPAAMCCQRGQGSGQVASAKCCGSSRTVAGDEGTAISSKSATIRNRLTTATVDVQSPFDRDLLFPPELVSYEPGELSLDDRWFRPVTLKRLLELRKDHPEAVLIAGNTELGVELYSKPDLPRRVHISIAQISKLTAVVDDAERGLIIGAAATWSAVAAAIAKAENARAGTPLVHQTSSLSAVRKQLRWFAGAQVRAVASVGGNVVTASPISDLNPVWIAAGAVLELADANAANGETRCVAAADFFVGYRRVDLRPTEVLVALIVPWNMDQFDITQSFKTSRRRDDDIAIVSAGIRLHLSPPPPRTGSIPTTDEAKRPDSSGWRIRCARIGLGGMASRTIAASTVESVLRGAPFTKETLDRALSVASSSLVLPQNVPGGMPEFRLALCLGFMFKAFVTAADMVDQLLGANRSIGAAAFATSAPGLGVDTSTVASVLKSDEERRLSRSAQIFESPSSSEVIESNSHVGKPILHTAAKLQVSGEATYVDDMLPASPRELHGALVLSSVPHARIVSIDVNLAMACPGVVDIVLATDVPGSNEFGVTPVLDELCFAEDFVTCVGQVIGLALADTLAHAEAAAACVDVKYDELPAILTIEEALDAVDAGGNEFVKQIAKHEISVGNVDRQIEGGPVVAGNVRIGAQEHFYLEPQGTIAVPGENDEFVIFASTQAATKTQEVVCKVLGVPMHKVVCRVKRLGGGFGGKESRSVFISAAAAVAAKKHNVPVRVILSRRDDMLATGTRHAFLAKYRCSYRPDGHITALDVQLYQNMGNTADLSVPVLDRALHHCQNCYDIPAVRFVGIALRTNSPSSTAFRGFGGPQGMLVAETIVEHVANATGLAGHVVRDVNMYGKHGNKSSTLVGMEFDPEPLVRCWDGVLSDSRYIDLLSETQKFNSAHRFSKRGVAAVPTMFGISFTFKTYNQAGALVHIYHTDGSVLISHGGVEMGQGLHTKLCQVAATALELPLEKVFISETATDKVANTSPSAASASTDMYGMAVLDACRTLSARLAPIKKLLGSDETWEAVIQHAWTQRVDLSAHGFYVTPSLDDVDLSRPNAKGRPFFYYTNGAAVSVVEIDVLTGRHEVLSTSIVMDVGRSLNPALDIGQIEGGFIQGLGWCTMEEIVRGSGNAHTWLGSGRMLTLGPGAYKVPGFTDIPLDFRVRVLSGVRNEKDTIHSSKAIGEPPLFLASSVFFAIRSAIFAARTDVGENGWFEMDSPATVERIRLASPYISHDALANAVGDGGGHAQNVDCAVRPALSL